MCMHTSQGEWTLWGIGGTGTAALVLAYLVNSVSIYHYQYCAITSHLSVAGSPILLGTSLAVDDTRDGPDISFAGYSDIEKIKLTDIDLKGFLPGYIPGIGTKPDIQSIPTGRHILEEIINTPSVSSVPAVLPKFARNRKGKKV